MSSFYIHNYMTMPLVVLYSVNKQTSVAPQTKTTLQNVVSFSVEDETFDWVSLIAAGGGTKDNLTGITWYQPSYQALAMMTPGIYLDSSPLTCYLHAQDKPTPPAPSN